MPRMLWKSSFVWTDVSAGLLRKTRVFHMMDMHVTGVPSLDGSHLHRFLTYHANRGDSNRVFARNIHCFRVLLLMRTYYCQTTSSAKRITEELLRIENVCRLSITHYDRWFCESSHINEITDLRRSKTSPTKLISSRHVLNLHHWMMRPGEIFFRQLVLIELVG